MCCALVITSGAGTSVIGPTFLRDLTYPAAADLLLLALAEVVGIANDAALGAAQRNVDDRALPGHPHRQRADRVDGLLRVEANAALARSASVVVLHAEAAEHLHGSVVHAGRNRKVELAQWVTQKFARRRIEAQIFGDLVELRLRDLERIKCLCRLFRGLPGGRGTTLCASVDRFTHCALRHDFSLNS